MIKAEGFVSPYSTNAIGFYGYSTGTAICRSTYYDVINIGEISNLLSYNAIMTN